MTKTSKPDKGEALGAWYPACWHLYTSPTDPNTISWAVIRVQQDREHGYDKEFLPVHFEAGRTGGRYRTQDGKWHTLPAGWVTKRPLAEQQDLYRAPALRAAKAAGHTGPVYVTEGESDADVAVAVGALAVTAGGATTKWHSHYSELLTDLDVVLVLDRDDEGIRAGEKLAYRLRDLVRSLRIVQPVGDGNKDLRDHLAAGHTLDELRDVDLAIPGLQGPGSQSQPEVGRNTTSTATAPEDDGRPNQLPHEYLVRRGELVERTWKDGEPIYKTVLGCVAWIDSVTEEDNGVEDTRYQRPTRDVRFMIERRDRTGAVVQQRELRVDNEKITKGTWAHEWPYPDTLVSRSRRAIDRTLDAIYTAVQSPTLRTPVYTATGWRRTDTGWIYVHGTGAIGRGGSLNLDVDIDGVLKRTALPEPTTDSEQLRQAYFDGTAPLQQLPARIAAPLEGFVWRSIIGGPQNMVLHLHGPRGTMKTAASRLLLQHIVPELRYPHAKEMASGASNLSTPKGMQRLLGAAKDVPMEIDDLAPDRGGSAEAQTRLAELARQTYNGSGQIKADRLPGKTVTELAPRCSLITTGEVTAGGSAETRCFNILVEHGAIPSVDLIAELETPARCDARSLLGASFVRWCAEHYDDLTAWITELTSVYNAAWRHTLQDLPHDEGVIGRLAEAAASYSVGVALQTTWLLEAGAITESEAHDKWAWTMAGIQEAARSLEADASDPAVKLVGWTQEALATKAAHLTGPNGGPPELDGDPNAPARYGWTPQYKTSPLDSSTTVTWHPNGSAIGTVPRHGSDRAYLVPDATIEVAHRMSARTETRWAETKVGFSSSLEARGWIKTTIEAGRKVRCPNREIDGGSRRVWDMERSILDGHFRGDDDDPDGASPTGPPPLDPRLANNPAYGEIPTNTNEVQHQPVAVPDDHTSPTEDSTEPKRALQLVTDHAADVSAPSPETNTMPTPETSTAADSSPTPSTGSAPRRTRNDHHYNHGADWAYPVLVIDTDAAYLPDGTKLVIDEDHVAHFGDAAELADALGIGHAAAPGQVWLTKRLTDRMGLVITDDDPLPDPDTDPKKFNAAIGERLTDCAEPLLEQTTAAGWHLGDDQAETPAQIRPRMRLHRNDGRVLTIVLAHYATLWDPRRTGPDHHNHPLPEPDEDPEGYGTELARRTGRLTDVLEQPWASSGGQMGAVIMDRIRSRARKERVEEAGPVPDLGDLQGQNSLETTWSWWRTFNSALLPELQRTPYLHRFDGRASWLLCAGTMNLGYGQPAHYEADHAAQAAQAKKLPFGLWRVTLPIWTHASLMPPHPAIPHYDPTEHGGDLITCWITTPSLRLLTANDHLDLDIDIHEAWIWPHQGRKLESWYTSLRKSLQTARGHEDEFRQLVDHASDTETAAHVQRELATWNAVADIIKGVYAGYIGRMISPATKYSKARPWHYQPVWRAAIVAESRRRDYRKLLEHFDHTGLAPVAAIGTDEYWYLSDSSDPASVAPQDDNGNLGKLRAKGEPRLLTGEHARKVCGIPAEGEPYRPATPIHRVFGEEKS